MNNIAIIEALAHLIENPEISFRILIRLDNVANKVYPTFGIRVATFFFCPDSGRKEYVSVIIGFHIAVGVLNNQKVQFFKHFADAWLIGH